MSSSGICLRLFDTNIDDPEGFWSTISFALSDFPELNSVAIVQILLEVILALFFIFRKLLKKICSNLPKF